MIYEDVMYAKTFPIDWAVNLFLSSPDAYAFLFVAVKLRCETTFSHESAEIKVVDFE